MSTIAIVVFIIILIASTVFVITQLVSNVPKKSNISANTSVVDENVSEISVGIKDDSQKIQGASTRNSCIVSVPISSDSPEKKKIPIGEPWYQNPNNPMQCFATVNQKCCTQTDLPNGEEGCMMDFKGYTPAGIRQWSNQCLQDSSIIDIDKLGILNTNFSGSWNAYEKDGKPISQEAQMFNVQINDTNLTIKENDSVFGMYKIVHITINPTKHIQGDYTSPSGTVTNFILEDDGEGKAIARIVETPGGSDQGQLTTYKLEKNI